MQETGYYDAGYTVYSLLLTLSSVGLPTVISYDIVQVGNLYGSVFEMLDAKSFADKEW